VRLLGMSGAHGREPQDDDKRSCRSVPAWASVGVLSSHFVAVGLTECRLILARPYRTSACTRTVSSPAIAQISWLQKDR